MKTHVMSPDFDTWLKHVDQFCWQMAGCSLHDLDDQPWADWYARRLPARKAAVKALHTI